MKTVIYRSVWVILSLVALAMPPHGGKFLFVDIAIGVNVLLSMYNLFKAIGEYNEG